MSEVSEYWKNHGKTIADKIHGRVFELSNGRQMCDECCNKDGCDDPTHQYRGNCRNCLGTGYNLTADEHNAKMKNGSSNI